MDNKKAVELFETMESNLKHDEKMSKVIGDIFVDNDLDSKHFIEVRDRALRSDKYRQVIVNIYGYKESKAELTKLVKEKYEEVIKKSVIETGLSKEEMQEREIIARKKRSSSIPTAFGLPQHEVKQRISLIKRFEDVFSKLRKPKRSDSLAALQEMTVLMIDAYEYLQLLNKEDVSKSDPEFLKEVEESVAEVNAYLKATREDVQFYESN